MNVPGVITAAFLTAALAMTAGPAAAGPIGNTVSARTQVYSWQWVDGSTQTQRSFPSSEYANKTRRIAILVGVRPSTPRHKVRLEVYQQGKWLVHSRARTSVRRGRARLPINPICTSGAWCKGTFSMRLRVLRHGAAKPATLPLTVTFDPGTPSTPVTPPPSKPRTSGSLAGPMLFQVGSNQTLGPPAITSTVALQNPGKLSEIVLDMTWDAPVSYSDNPVAGYYVLVTDDFSIQTWESAWYVEYGADQRDVRISGPMIYANNPPKSIDVTVVAVDSRGAFGTPAPTVHLQIGCDAYGPATGAQNPYRTLCEHGM